MIIFYGFLFYFIAALIGISAGYHRYFSHNSFRTNSVVEVILLFFGMICGARSCLTWCGVHRMHHKYSDTFQDPHSPEFKGFFTVLFSRFKVKTIPRKFIKDLLSNPRVMFFHKHLGMLYIGYILFVSLFGLEALIIFALSPFYFSWIFYGLINVLSHKNRYPVNNMIVNLFAPGEGWHKDHHNAPGKPVMSKWDPTGYFIKVIRETS